MSSGSGSGSEYVVVVNDLDAAYGAAVPAGDGVLRLSTAYVSSTLSWVPARSGETQLVMNSTLAKMSYNFPSNFYLTRTFRVTATNVAEGFDCHDIVLNLDAADVVTTVPAMIQAQNEYPGGGPPLGKIYTVRSIDTESSKTQPPSFLPTITGATTVTLTWVIPVPAYLTRLFVNWTPVLPASVLNTLETSYVQPLVYYTEFGTTPIVIPDTFVVGQQYLFKFTCEATTSTLSMTQNMTYTSAYIVPTDPMYPIPIINPPTGATTITHSWTSSLATTMTLSWTPTTITPFITQAVPGDGSLQSIAISGFLPNNQYTFTYTFAPDNSGVYDKYVKVVGPYSVLYIPPTVSFLPPVTSSNVPSMQLEWSFAAPPTGAPVFVQVSPNDPASLVPSYTATVPGGTTRLAVNGLTLGTAYRITYIIQADGTGVYGSSNVYYPSDVIVFNNPVINAANFIISGGTNVTVGWSNGIVPAMPGTLTWASSSGIAAVGFTSTKTSLTTANYPFVIGQPYNFTFSFAQTRSQTHYPATYQLTYVPQYLPRPAVTIAPPASVGDGRSVQLSWDQGALVSTGSVVYNIVGSLNSTTCNITNYQSNLSIAGLSLGSNYNIVYTFYPDSTGVYGGTTVKSPTAYVPRGQPYLLPSDIAVSGGTTVTLTWQLKMDVGGVTQNVDGVPVTVTWTPTTASMGLGQTTTANQIFITGFEANGATGYWFTLAYAMGQSTVAYTTVYPPLTSPPYSPILKQPQTPVIYVDQDPNVSYATSGSTANITLKWIYIDMANHPIVTAVSILALNTTGAITNIRVEPYDRNHNLQTSIVLESVTTGLEYDFKFVFDPDTTGTILGSQRNLTYIVPLVPDIATPILTNVVGRSGTVSITWAAYITPYDPTAITQSTVMLDTLINIVATPPLDPNAVPIVANEIQSLTADKTAFNTYTMSGLVSGLTYLFDLMFLSRGTAPTTWPQRNPVQATLKIQ